MVFLVGVAVLQLAMIQGSGFHTKLLAATCCISCVSWLKPVGSCIGEGQIKDSGWRHKLLLLLSLR